MTQPKLLFSSCLLTILTALVACGTDATGAGQEPVAGSSGLAGSGGASTGGAGASAGASFVGGLGGSDAAQGGSLTSSGGAVGSSGSAGRAGSQPASGGTASGGTASGGGVSPGGAASGGAASVAGGSGDASTGQAGAGGAAGSAGSASGAGSGGAAPIQPPVSDRSSTIKIASAGSQYKVEGNIPYGPLPAQRLDVIYPANRNASSELLPAVVMFHGGGWIQGDKATMASFYSRFLAHGFVVCTVEYRVANGSSTGGIAPAAVQDALLAAKWFWDHMDYYRVDRTRYVVTGGSAGGHLALMVGMATPAAQLGPTSPTDFKIAAIVNGYGPADVADLLRRNTGFAVQWLPANTPNRDELAKRLSPLSYVRKDVPPLISVHGANDSTIPVAQSQTLDTQLKAAGADAEIRFVPGAGHGFSTPAAAWPDAEKAMFDFLVKRGIGK